jgi:hypothetical protein
MFDFDAAIAAAAKDAKSTAVEALLLAPSGGGKSTLMGTFKEKTLYIYSGGENHGVKSAMTYGSAYVTPLCIDSFDSEGKLDSDQTLANLEDTLTNRKRITDRGFRAIAVDGASELEFLIRSSSAWKKACQTAKGGHNSFEEPKATLSGFRPFITLLKGLQRDLGLHFVLSCPLDVKELGANGDILEASPCLQGYSVADSLCRQFGDILVVGKMTKANIIKHKLQFGTEVTKVAKEENGTIKKMLNYGPRIAGIINLTPYMDADLSLIVEMKKKAFGGT